MSVQLQPRLPNVDPAVRLREIFVSIDRNGDQSLNLSEFFYFIQLNNPSISQAQAEVLFSKIDKKSTGKITWPDFMEAARDSTLGLYYILNGGLVQANHPVFIPISRPQSSILAPESNPATRRRLTAKELRIALELYERIDVDHDEKVTLAEFRNGIKATDPSYPESDIQRLFTNIDTDNTGTICVDEFLAGISSGVFNASIFSRLVPAIPGFDWEVSPSEFTYGNKLGEGSYGEVLSARWRGAKVAVKILKGIEKDATVQQEFLSEVNILSKIRHPNCLLFLGASVKPPKFMMVTEFCGKGTLTNTLQARSLRGENYHKVVTGIALGLAYLHLREPKIIHRDLKPDNILLDDNFTPKLADFGLSIFRSFSMKANQICGTPAYMAPEIWRGEGSYDEKVDIYAYSIVLFECTYFQSPFACRTIDDYRLTSNSDVRPVLTAQLHPTIANIIRRGWDKNPAARPTASEIVVDLGKIIGSFSSR